MDYLEHLATASEDVLLISLADKAHNLGSIVRDYRGLGDRAVASSAPATFYRPIVHF